MGVQFVLGRSGTGKTRSCIEAICAALKKNEDRPLLLLVPEQASFQAERAILSHPDIAGFDRLSVLSFERLQHQLLGREASKTHLSALGRQMVVRQILQEHRDRLQVFSASVASPGFVRQMTQTVEELQRAALGPEAVEQFLRQNHDGYQGRLQYHKFADIRLVYAAYLSRVEGRFIDPNRQLQEARAAVSTSPHVRGASLWVDGFSGFSTAEMLLLREMIAAAKETVLALCLDPQGLEAEGGDDRREPLDLFAPTRITYVELRRILKDLKLPTEKPHMLPSPWRFAGCPPLAHLERSLFQSDVQPRPSEGCVRCVGAADERAECQFVARQIQALVQKRSYRYRDIAVIVSNLGRYEPYIHAYFTDQGIPFFIDRQRAVDQHPCATLIRSALILVTEGFHTSEVLTLLRTGLTGITHEEADVLEDYCLAFGVSGADWLAETNWSFAGLGTQQGFDECAIDRIRRRLCRPLRKLRVSLGLNESSEQMLSARQFVEALFAFLNDLDVAESIHLLASEAQAAGDLSRADRHQQFHQAAMALMEELLTVYGETRHTAELYGDLLLDAFHHMTLAQIPPSMDQVLVGSIERSRHPEVRVVFLVGTTQRQFPAPLRSGGLLTDQDREAADLGGLALGGGTLQALSQQRYLAYIAFTRASERLYITYPLSDERGNAAVRSQFVDELMALFSDLREGFSAGVEDGPLTQYSAQEWAERFCRHARDPEEARRIVGLLNREECLAEVAEVVCRAVTLSRAAALEPDVVLRLFGDNIDTSATRLATYATCPYQYFAKYVLGLKPRQSFTLEPIDLGTFYHRVLELWIDGRIERGDWQEVSEAILWDEVSDIIDRVFQENPYWSNFVGRSRTNAFLAASAGEVLRGATHDILTMIRAGAFRPVRTEATFGVSESDLGPYEIPLSPTRTIRIHGKIDRIDLTTQGGRETAIVMDYKRRDRAVNWSSLYHGLDLQLVIYLNALSQSRKYGRVAGAFFLPVEAVATVGKLSDMGRNTHSFGHKAKGIFCGDIASHLDEAAEKDSRFYNFYMKRDGYPYGNYMQRGVLQPQDFDSVRAFVQRQTKALASRLIEGRIDIRPIRHGNQSPCSRCDYLTVCRFDWQLHAPNFLETKSKSDVLAGLAGAATDE